MGLYLNPNADAFTQDINTRIYVDKSLVIDELNKLVCTKDDFVCISRPRRFGKSMAGNMISAYYSKGCNTRDVFSQMKLGQVSNYDRYLNKFIIYVQGADLFCSFLFVCGFSSVIILLTLYNSYCLAGFKPAPYAWN